jgi:predicted RNA-binding protein with PIN domain
MKDEAKAPAPMRYLIDGYNLLHVMGLMRPRAGPVGLQKARTALLGVLAGALGAQARQATVIFDAGGAPPDAPHALTHRGVQVCFARSHDTADDLIREMIHREGTPRHLTVVSDDHNILRAARHRGCVTMPCEAFLTWLQRCYHRRRPSPSEPDEKAEGLQEGQTQGWLREFAALDQDPTLGDPFSSSLDDV